MENSGQYHAEQENETRRQYKRTAQFIVVVVTKENVLCIHDFNHFVVNSHSIIRLGQSSSHFESVGVVYLI